MDEQRAADEAWRFLRKHTEAEIRFDDRYGSIRYVVAPDGRLVAAVESGVLDAADVVVFVPENAEGAMEIQVAPEPLERHDPDGGSDRWRIYHGDPHLPCWTVMAIEAARYERFVVDGEALMRRNPLAADEPALCRRVNREHVEDLRRACRRLAGADVEAPMLVGVDSGGFDVRRRFDVIRIEAPQPMRTAGDADRALERMFADA